MMIEGVLIFPQLWIAYYLLAKYFLTDNGQRVLSQGQSIAAVRLVLRCIVGQLFGCHGDLAGSALGVHGLLLSPFSLGRLVI